MQNSIERLSLLSFVISWFVIVLHDELDDAAAAGDDDVEFGFYRISVELSW